MLLRTDSRNEEFIKLIEMLDENLARVNGEEQNFFTKFNSISEIRHVVLLFRDGEAIACGAFKYYKDRVCEIKRVFVKAQYRSKGYGSEILLELEKWAKEEGYREAILETSKKQLSAQRLYLKKNFEIRDNYGVYSNIDDSVCFTKTL